METLFITILISFLLATIAILLFYLIYDIYLRKYFIDNANNFKIKYHINEHYCFQWGDYFAFITPNKIVSIHNIKNYKCLLTGMFFIYSNKMYKKLIKEQSPEW